MLVVAKAFSFLGLVLLVGAGVMASFLLGPSAKANLHVLRFGKNFGASLLIAGAILEVLGLYFYLPASLSVSQKLAYINSSQFFLFFSAECLWVYLAVCLLLNHKFKKQLRQILTVTIIFGLAVSFALSTNSLTGADILSSIIHIVCGSIWAGVVIYTAVLPAWENSSQRLELYALMKRVSLIGLTSFALMSLTGVYAAVTHIGTTDALLGTSYGRVLLFKALLVANTLILAFANRVVVLPILKSKGVSAKLAQFVRVEAVLLVMVLLATGLLTNSSLLTLSHEHFTDF